MKKIHLCFIGSGNMAEAMISSLFADSAGRYHVSVSDISEERRRQIAEKFPQVDVFSENAAAAQNAEYIVLAIKPIHFKEVLESIRSVVSKDTVIISIMAGVSIAAIQRYTNAKVVRTMPNLAAKIGYAMTALDMHLLNETQQAVVLELFQKIGVTTVLDENAFDAFTAVSGSGIAYVYQFMDSMIQAGKAHGLEEDQARTIINQTFLGAVKMSESNMTMPLSTMIEQVCSKGGTTIAAISSLKDNQIETRIKEAVDAAYVRSLEIKESFEQ